MRTSGRGRRRRRRHLVVFRSPGLYRVRREYVVHLSYGTPSPKGSWLLSYVYAGQKQFLTEVGKNEPRKSQTTLRQTFLSFVKSSRAAGFKFWQFHDFYFHLISKSLWDINPADFNVFFLLIIDNTEMIDAVFGYHLNNYHFLWIRYVIFFLKPIFFCGTLYSTKFWHELHREIFVRPLVSPSDLRPATEIKEK